MLVTLIALTDALERGKGEDHKRSHVTGTHSDTLFSEIIFRLGPIKKRIVVLSF